MYEADVRPLEHYYLTGHSIHSIMKHYTGLDPHGQMGRYFAVIRPVLDAIVARSEELGLSE